MNFSLSLANLGAVAVLLGVVFIAVKLTLLVQRLQVLTVPAQPTGAGSSSLAVASPYLLIKARHGWMLANPHDFYLGKALVEYGEYGEIESRYLVSLLALRPGKVIEVGANIGTHTIPLAKALAVEKREIVVFEPQPFIFQNLCANLALNGITNATAWPWACGTRAETVHFSTPDYTAHGNFGAVSMTPESRQGSVAVPCVRLDDVVGPGPVGLIKIDVEGYELPALQGAIGILTSSRPLLYVENDRVEKSQALIEWLWSRNYRLFWHIPPLFNPENIFKKKENIYGIVFSFNMLGVPREVDIPVDGMQEIMNAAEHPLSN